ncbi:hypothetical protein BOX15_Mlig009947g1, partial [Macrostomum lignano]
AVMSSDTATTAATSTSASASSSAEPAASVTANAAFQEPPILTMEDGAAAARRVNQGGGGGGQRSRTSATAKAKSGKAARRPATKAGGGRSRAAGGGGGGARSGGGGSQSRRRARGGGSASGPELPSGQAPLPPGAVRIFTDDFLRLNAQREKLARQLRRSVIVREEEALLRARHTEDLADAVADLLARRDAEEADAELLTAGLADLCRRVVEAFPQLASTADAGDGPEGATAEQRLAASINQLSNRLDPEAVRQVLVEFSAAFESEK